MEKRNLFEEIKEGMDCLRSLREEEMRQVVPISEEDIQLALEQGWRDVQKFKMCSVSYVIDNRRYK